MSVRTLYEQRGKRRSVRADRDRDAGGTDLLHLFMLTRQSYHKNHEYDSERHSAFAEPASLPAD